MIVKRFSTFDEAKSAWLELEKSTQHYPFQSFWYNKLFAETFGDKNKIHILGVYDNEHLLAIGAFEIIDKSVLFVGMKQVLNRQDITDYGDLLYDQQSNNALVIWQSIQAYFKELGFALLQLDYVREDSKTYQICKDLGSVSFAKQDVSPYILVTDSWEEYLTTLDKKDRHELQRKIRKLEREAAFKLCTDETIHEEFDEFITLHKLSDSDKEKFMSKEMENVFWQIVVAEKTDWQVHICSLIIDEKHVASVFMFVNNDNMLLYNSGFDPEFRKLSVGLLIHSFLIKKAIAEKKKVYDFLRGSERYKYDLGAKDIQLYQIKIPLT